MMTMSEREESKEFSAGDRDTRSIKLANQTIDSRELFLGTREILIRHGGENYRLRLTGQNKLILTK